MTSATDYGERTRKAIDAIMARKDGAMTDNRTTELTAIERLRAMLDERGVEWRKYTKGQVETTWFVPSGMTEFDNHFCSASVSKNHREGPLYYKGYVISPQAAIEASLGKADNASANAGDIDALRELRDLACDINAAEIIDHVHITHRGWTFDSRWLDSWHNEFDRITDKLEQAVAATLGNPTCEYVIEDNMNETDGMGDVWFRCTNCGTCYDYQADDWLMKMSYCPKCGATVKGVR